MDEGTAWIILIMACILEPCWVICLDKSENFKHKAWGIAAVVLVLLCLYCLSIPEKWIGPGISYSILAGVGAAGIVIAGRVLYKERLTPRKLFFISLIIIGIVGVRLLAG
jgi:quaternary ammonium compound-resistance protein SugE